MKLKDVLEKVVSEIEETGALAGALQDRLISKNLLSEQEIAEAFSKIRRNDRLAALRVAISQLPG